MALAFFIQDLDANVKKLGLFLIIDEIGLIELDGIRARIARDRLHVQILLGNGLPIFFLRLGGHDKNCQKSN